MCVSVNSYACCIWIVNDITDSNICLFSVSVFFLLLFLGIVCVRRCVVCVCVLLLIAINSHACYIWIINDITDPRTCFFPV